jgi:hypothetical protein
LAPGPQAWLAALDDGTPERASLLPDLRRLAAGAAAASAAGAAADGAAPAAPARSGAPDADALADIVDLNFTCIREDEAVAELRAPGGAAAASRDLVGLWPAVALLNHSCAPNTATAAVEVRGARWGGACVAGVLEPFGGAAAPRFARARARDRARDRDRDRTRPARSSPPPRPRAACSCARRARSPSRRS